METSQAKIFKSLSEPAVGSVRVLKDAATKIESVIDDIPLSFPPELSLSTGFNKFAGAYAEERPAFRAD